MNITLSMHKVIKFFILLIALFACQDLTCSRKEMVGSQILMNENGDAVSVWIVVTKKGYCIQSSTRNKRGHWSSPHNVSNISSYSAGFQAQMDSLGNVLVSWLGLDEKTQTLRIYANSTKNSKKWGEPIAISGLDHSVEGPFTSSIKDDSSTISTAKRAITFSTLLILLFFVW